MWASNINDIFLTMVNNYFFFKFDLIVAYVLVNRDFPWKMLVEQNITFHSDLPNHAKYSVLFSIKLKRTFDYACN